MLQVSQENENHAQRRIDELQKQVRQLQDDLNNLNSHLESATAKGPAFEAQLVRLGLEHLLL